MAEDSAQEKTEQPTSKRLNEAREKGQVARSRELSTMAILLASSFGILAVGEAMVGGLLSLMEDLFSRGGSTMIGADDIPKILINAIADALIILIPFFMIVVAAAFFSPMALSGWSFSVKALAFDWKKMDPVKGLGRVFSVKGLVELVKALAKFGVVLSIAIFLLWTQVDDLLRLGTEPVLTALPEVGSLLGWSFVMLSCAMILIAAIDVPFQLWDHTKQLKMTRQEIKDEYKETDGNPELKRSIREKQQALADARMMEEVPKADVIVTNPTHFAVALKYDQDRSVAPIVVAKGKDLVALKIRAIAVEHDVPILSAPPLSRALFYSTELNDEIPAGLYLAVAQVLAYIYKLRDVPASANDDVPNMGDLPIPDDLRRDEE